MASPQAVVEGLGPRAESFYRRVLTELTEAGARFLVGGAYALSHYTGVVRHTKDFDLFVMSSEVEGMLRLLAGAGFATELTFPHWLGKAREGDLLVDLIFSSGLE